MQCSHIRARQEHTTQKSQIHKEHMNHFRDVCDMIIVKGGFV